jgi:hypothetical protein
MRARRARFKSLTTHVDAEGRPGPGRGFNSRRLHHFLSVVIAHMFERFIGIDYSGAQTPETRLKGLQVFVAHAASHAEPERVGPPSRPLGHWSRRELYEWLRDRLREGVPTLVGIDHGFSFPLAYFDAHRLAHNWPAFLDDLLKFWPTGRRGVAVQAIRAGALGRGRERSGSAKWRRACERLTRAKSVFHFDVPGSVAKSTFAGLAWIQALRLELGQGLHCWPFDGWQVPPGRSVVAEVYPSLWKSDWDRAERTLDEHDAYVVAAALRAAAADGRLPDWMSPKLDPELVVCASIEGWILGAEVD